MVARDVCGQAIAVLVRPISDRFVDLGTIHQAAFLKERNVETEQTERSIGSVWRGPDDIPGLNQ